MAAFEDGLPRHALAALLVFVALNALGGGIYGLVAHRSSPAAFC